MAQIEIQLPRMGEGIIEATITKWLVEVGDRVEEDDSLVEVATDKVDSEIPAPEEGVVNKILVEEGAVPKVGDVLMMLETRDDGPEPERKEVLREVERLTPTPPGEEATPEHEEPEAQVSETSHTVSGRFLSPLVRKIASKEGISPDELEGLSGSGKDGRITKKDILGYLGTRVQGAAAPKPPSEQKSSAASETESVPVIEKGPVTAGPDEEIVEMDRMRKLIAGRMVHSVHTSPHVTSFVEADVTNLAKWRDRIKNEFLKKEGQKITFTPLFIEAAARALRDFPMVNVSVEDTSIIIKKQINIGMATALPSGNLIVPVIKQADEKNLIGLAKAVNDLANRARENKLLPDEITGGTFTISNFGSFQNLTGTPIINQPEVAILGVGAVVKKPAVIETEAGDTIGIRHKMILSLSYDHRVVDGALGGMFLKRVADYLEQFDVNRSF